MNRSKRLMTEPDGSLRPLKGSALHQRQLINTSVFSLLRPYILPYHLLIPTHRRDQITPGPKVLPRIVPLPPLNCLLLSWFLLRVMLGGSHRGDTMSFPESHSRNCQTGLVSPAKLGGFQFLLIGLFVHLSGFRQIRPVLYRRDYLVLPGVAGY